MTLANPRETFLASYDELPLCLHCLEPVAPVERLCERCGSAVGQLTPYLPWEHIRWEADGWGRMWEQVWDRNRSLPGRLFRLAVIAWFVPVLLPFTLPRLWRSGRRSAA